MPGLRCRHAPIANSRPSVRRSGFKSKHSSETSGAKPPIRRITERSFRSCGSFRAGLPGSGQPESSRNGMRRSALITVTNTFQSWATRPGSPVWRLSCLSRRRRRRTQNPGPHEADSKSKRHWAEPPVLLRGSFGDFGPVVYEVPDYLVAHDLGSFQRRHVGRIGAEDQAFKALGGC
jgi:hypothetical protein